MVKISKNKRQPSSKLNEKKTEKKVKQSNQINSNRNLLYWSIAVAAINFIISYLILPKDIPGNFTFLNLIYSIALFLSIYLSPNKKVCVYVKYIFLFVFVLLSIIYLPLFNVSESSVLKTLQKYIQFTMLPIGILGIIVIWQNKKKIATEESNANEFESTKKLFGRIAGLGRITLLAYLAITILVTALLFYKLDNFDFWSDEKQTTQAAVGYYNTGEYYQWDFIKDEANTSKKYNRALPHVWLIAQSYNLFGVSEWSSRFISAISGILFIILGFFVALFFTKSRLTALLFIFAIALSYDFLHLFRWARMYAILIPYTFIVFHVLYKAITGTNKYTIINQKLTSVINKYLNFNYLHLIFFFPLLYLGFKIHPNFAAILPPTVLFLIYLVVAEKENKYYAALGAVLILFLGIYFFFPHFIPLSRMSFFEQNNSYYLSGFFDQPFNLFTGIVLFLVGFSVFIFSTDKRKKQRFAFLYIMIISFYLLFTYVADYPQSFRYISHLAPLGVLVIVSAFSALFVVFSKPWQIALLSLLLVSNLASHFYIKYPDLYIEHPIYNAKHDIAFQTIEDKHQRGEAVFMQFGTPYYLDDLDKSTPMVNMSRNKRYSFQTFLKDINTYKSGWISWSTFNQYHVDDDIVAYCSQYFKKYHGFGIDNTNKEVYYYQKEDIVSDSIYKTDSNFPQANLKLNKPYSFTFWISINKGTNGFPLKFMNKNEDLIRFTRYDKGVFYAKYNEKDSTSFIIPLDNKFHFFSLEQSGNQADDSVRIFIDKQPVANIKLSNSSDTLAKLHANRRFNGQVDDMRVYTYELNDKQRNILSTRELSLKKRELIVKGKSFTPLFHWTKN